MNYDLLSPRVSFTMKSGETIVFKRFLRNGEEIPSAEKCKGEIVGISLAYAFCGEQDFGIRPLAKAFDALNDCMIIKRAPLEIAKADGVKAIMYGEDVSLNKNMIRGAKQAGVIAYWDKANLIICARPEYSFVIDSIKEIIKPNHVRFAFEEIFGGRGNLVILSAAKK